MSGFDDPALLFLKSHKVESFDDIIAYADFLRTESGLSTDPPVELGAIYQRFGFPMPGKAPLHREQGMTIPADTGPRNIVKESDRSTRQRFTEAHELMEHLFMQLPGEIRLDRSKQNVFGTQKERICEAGAANLLMPVNGF